MADVVVDGARKVFGDGADAVVALDGLSLRIEDGVFATMLGPSGCGKTTALNLVAGFERPTAGEVRVGGRPVGRPGPDRAVVFQDVALFPWLRVEDNVAFGLRIAGLAERAVRERVDALLERVGLTAFRRRYPAELSGGMRQRVSLARVLALDSQVLLMDEPFGALDAQTRVLMQEFLTALWERERKTVLFITHDIDEAVFLADRLYVMTARPGRIKAAIEVDLPRPRDFAIMTAPRFHELRDRALALVREEALRTAQPLAGVRR
ncbi:MAG: ABC transporter ATP-binding protein [Candidatus Limnocylindria bacterium]